MVNYWLHNGTEMTTELDKPSEKIRTGLKKILEQPGELQRFATKFDFEFGSLYKIATRKIEQPGIDYGNQIIAALKDWNSKVGASNG
jgi:hypothetical protein